MPFENFNSRFPHLEMGRQGLDHGSVGLTINGRGIDIDFEHSPLLHNAGLAGTWKYLNIDSHAPCKFLIERRNNDI